MSCQNFSTVQCASRMEPIEPCRFYNNVENSLPVEFLPYLQNNISHGVQRRIISVDYFFVF